jgi:DNA processing protein
MSGDNRESLFLSLVAFSILKTPTRIDAFLRTQGPESLSDFVNDLSHERLEELSHQADSLSSRGVYAVLRGDALYPDSLIVKGRSSAPILLCHGNPDLLNSEGIGMCGSRAASELGLKAAAACGEEVSNRKLSVISGYAKGVDTATHLAALRTGGSTVIVLAEGFDHFRVKKVFSDDFDLRRVLVISQFAPSQPWLAHAAMTRNKVIFGLGRALVVVEAGERGGTLAAGEGALKIGRPVFVLNFGKETPAGNSILLQQGGTSVKSREELGRILELRPRPTSLQTALPL